VYRYGHLVLDIHGGVSDIRDRWRSDPAVTSKTMFVLMSSTKPLAAACLYMLKERGQLSWDDRCPSTGRSSASMGRRPSPCATC